MDGWMGEAVLNSGDLMRLLTRHHESIADLLMEGEAALGRSPGIDIAELAAIRWRLLRQLRHYQLVKHVELFDPLLRRGDVKQACLAGAAKDRCIAMGNRVNDHVMKWSSKNMDASYRVYLSDATKLIADLRGHLAKEASDVRLLLKN